MTGPVTSTIVKDTAEEAALTFPEASATLKYKSSAPKSLQSTSTEDANVPPGVRETVYDNPPQLSAAVTHCEEAVTVAPPLAASSMVPPDVAEMLGAVKSTTVMDVLLSELTLPEASVTRK